MKKIIPFLISGILAVGAFGCQNENPSATSEQPGNTNESAQTQVDPASPVTDKVTEKVPQTTENAENNSSEATDDTANQAGETGELTEKLAEALPGNTLEVVEKDGDILIKGTVGSQEELKAVEQVVSQLKSNKSVKVEATVESQKN